MNQLLRASPDQTATNPRAVVSLLGGAKVLGRTVRSASELDRLVQKGLPRRALEQLMLHIAPEPERARFRNRVVPRASFLRRATLSPTHSATAERLARVTALACAVWEDEEAARLFLWRPHPELEGRKPIDAALTEIGAREVEEILQRGLHGLPA